MTPHFAAVTQAPHLHFCYKWLFKKNKKRTTKKQEAAAGVNETVSPACPKKNASTLNDAIKQCYAWSSAPTRIGFHLTYGLNSTRSRDHQLGQLLIVLPPHISGRIRHSGQMNECLCAGKKQVANFTI